MGDVMAKKKMYWGPEQEEAVATYIRSESIGERHQIFEEVIQTAFLKLIESIFYTYNFNRRLGNLQDIEYDLLIYLYEKIEKFDPDKGYKSFSFFGTVAKNWLIQQQNAAKKNITIDKDKTMQYMHTISVDAHKTKEKSKHDKEFISMLTNNIETINGNTNFNDEDRSVAQIIVNILKKYPDLNIYNKKQVYLFLREGTGLPPRKITKSLKKIKEIYQGAKEDFYD
jgi:hypothetical protein